MINYSDIVKKARKEGKAEKMGVQLFKFDKKNPELVGIYLGADHVQFKDNLKETMEYTFQTDSGVVKIRGTAQIDRDLAPQWLIGQLYVISITGEVSTGKGNPMKTYDCFHIPLEIA